LSLIAISVVVSGAPAYNTVYDFPRFPDIG